jgi:N4-(beta-N-acetylglucosaminyl)-L-asparaginase
MSNWTRRRFFLTTLAGGIAGGARKLFSAAGANGNDAGRLDMLAAQAGATKGVRPLIISSSNGLRSLDRGMDILKKGGDTLDAVLAVVTVLEDDPDETSVGYGGLPNEDGDVELDASVMHGPTRRAGAVAALQQIKNASLVAKAVMEKTDHVLLVGPGALRFGEMQGFERMKMLTEKSRVAWLAWKASTASNWAPGLQSPEWKEHVTSQLPSHLSASEKTEWADWIRDVVTHPPTGTINCLALSEKGEISGTTTTSGLAWKIAGRVGDSAIIGAGLYVDNEVGAAGSTGRGEETIRVAGAHTIVELMSKGMPPKDACLEALQRIVRNYNGDKTRLKKFDVHFYALNKDGDYAGASLWTSTEHGRRMRYAVHDGTTARIVRCAPLLEGSGG